MPLVRRVARPLLAMIFVYGGLDALRNPAAKAPAADKVLTRLPPALPVIGTTEQLVRADAAAKVLGGTMLALGRFPRLSALGLIATLVPTTLAGHRPWEETDPVQRKLQTLQVCKNASILGGLLLATVDTEGRPSLGWRARRAGRDVQRTVAGTRAVVSARRPD
ncbi:MAG: DoxX family protein [bacterium]